MGGIEESERPLKRVKVPFGESDSSSLKLSLREAGEPALDFSLRDSMARSLPSRGDRDAIGSKGIIKRPEFIKIITGALYSLGYSQSGAFLEQESGIPLHSTIVNLFMEQVRAGKWDESVTTLHEIGLSDECIVKSASFLILEQKFLALLKNGEVMEALDTLRNRIVPLGINIGRVHELAAYIIFPPLSRDTAGSKSGSAVLEKLQKLFPAAIMIPEKRLEQLVEQALDVQRDACAYHNSLDSELSLYSDHHCGTNRIPSQTLQSACTILLGSDGQVLEAHCDEVWFLQFSHNGKFLASSSKDRSAIIWEVEDTGKVSLKHKLMGHGREVSIVSWSPDDKQLLTCGVEENIRRWDVNSGKCLHIYEKAGVGLVSCGWLPGGQGVFSGMTDKSICLWDLNGQEIESWKGQRTLKISDMAVTNDGKKIITMCRETAILLLDVEAKCERLIRENQMITSFSLSKDNKFLLVNLLNQEIHLWRLEGDPEVVSRYRGHKRTRFVIRSCFGGLEQAFIASGSEDSKVYVWHRESSEPLFALPGHSGAVNCVSWSPTNPHILASGSDDHTIRIWGLHQVKVSIS